MTHSLNRHGLSIVAGCVSLAMLWCGTTLVAAQNYPLPKPKPSVISKATPQYPLPKPNPRRRIQTEETEKPRLRVPAPKPRKPKGSRAAEADDPGQPDVPARAWSTVEIAAARTECRALLKGIGITYTEADPIGGPGECGIAAPIKVTAIGKRRSVSVSPAATINCKLAAAAVRWMDTKIQALATKEFSEPVVQIQNAASYACRRRNNQKTGKLSEHALGNALDVASFTLASGKVVTVLKGWRGQKDDTLVEEVVSKVITRATPESRFLRQAHAAACEVFSTILGPEADQYHVNHFHLDLGRGGRYLVCR